MRSRSPGEELVKRTEHTEGMAMDSAPNSSSSRGEAEEDSHAETEEGARPPPPSS